MPRIRTIQEAYREIKSNDPDTALSAFTIRRLILSNTIPHIKTGNKYLINLDVLEEYLLNPQKTAPRIITGGIRCIEEGRL